MCKKPDLLSKRPDFRLMSSFDSLLDSLRLRSEIQNRVVLGEPWGVEFPARSHLATFHFMEHGRGVVTVPGAEPVTLEQGDLAIVFSDQGHSVCDISGTKPTGLLELLEKADVICKSGLTLKFGGDGPESSVIGGDFSFAESATHPLWRMLPPMLVSRKQSAPTSEWLAETLSLLSREAMEMHSGARVVLDRLCDVLLIQALRDWVGCDQAASGLPAAVKDRAIDSALTLIQKMPAESWTVESLARHVALSRSTFAERFRRLTGETPMEYLGRWRMHIAAGLLREGNDNVASIAEKTGYESEASFAKAFKRMTGVAPGAFRRGATV